MKKSAKERRLGGKDKKKKQRKQIGLKRSTTHFFFLSFCNVMQIPVFNLFCVSFLLWVRRAALQ